MSFVKRTQNNSKKPRFNFQCWMFISPHSFNCTFSWIFVSFSSVGIRDHFAKYGISRSLQFFLQSNGNGFASISRNFRNAEFFPWKPYRHPWKLDRGTFAVLWLEQECDKQILIGQKAKSINCRAVMESWHLVSSSKIVTWGKCSDRLA